MARLMGSRLMFRHLSDMEFHPSSKIVRRDGAALSGSILPALSSFDNITMNSQFLQLPCNQVESFIVSTVEVTYL